MPFLRNDNFLGAPDTRENMGFIACQQWWNGAGSTSPLAQLGVAGIGTPRSLDRSTPRHLDLGSGTVSDRYHHHRGLDYSFVINRK